MEVNHILETIRMVEEEHLDIRTITMGISLLDCMDSNIEAVCEKVYQKITTKAKALVAVGEAIEWRKNNPLHHLLLCGFFLALLLNDRLLV